MKNIFILGSVFSACILTSCGNSKNIAAVSSTKNLVAVAQLMSTKDSTQHIGTAKFYKVDATHIRLDLELTIKERADSNVAVHFHEHGDCGNMGNNTHGHWNPTKENHGQWGSAAFHSGDIGNIMLDANGHGTKSVTTDRWSVDGGDKDIIGKGIIVHGGTDDYKTQPTGNSGPRIGCGAITKL